MPRDEQHRLTAAEVLKRYKDDDLPAFVEVSLTDVNQVGLFGERPLNVAAVRGSEAEVDALLEGGADVDATGEHGYTALHEAASQGHPEVVKILLAAGARRDIRNEFGDTALDLARSGKHWQILEVLEGGSTMAFDGRPNPGEEVLLVSIPAGFTSDLPADDQTAIAAVVGKTVRLISYCDDGRAELQFTDVHGVIHFLYVEPIYIKAVG